MSANGNHARTHLRIDGVKISGDAHVNPSSKSYYWMLGGSVAVHVTKGQKVDVYLSGGGLYGSDHSMFTGFILSS